MRRSSILLMLSAASLMFPVFARAAEPKARVTRSGLDIRLGNAALELGFRLGKEGGCLVSLDNKLAGRKIALTSDDFSIGIEGRGPLVAADFTFKEAADEATAGGRRLVLHFDGKTPGTALEVAGQIGRPIGNVPPQGRPECIDRFGGTDAAQGQGDFGDAVLVLVARQPRDQERNRGRVADPSGGADCGQLGRIGFELVTLSDRGLESDGRRDGDSEGFSDDSPGGLGRLGAQAGDGFAPAGEEVRLIASEVGRPASSGGG